MSAVNVVGLSKRYGKDWALRDIDFSIDQGQCTGLAGLNGAGKTSLIKCLLNFTATTTGTIEIFSECSTKPSARRYLNFVPEKFSAPSYLKGIEYLTLMAKLEKRAAHENTWEELLSSMDFDPRHLRRPMSNYSKGMVQKIGLAHALTSDRPILLLDEPMSGLDPKARVCMKKHIQTKKASGCTVIFTSHSMADIDETCDRIIVLDRGTLR